MGGIALCRTFISLILLRCTELMDMRERERERERERYYPFLYVCHRSKL